MKKIACVAFAALLAGCQTSPPAEIKTVIVEKLVPVPCIEKAPDRPVYKTGKGPEPSDIEKGAILIGDFEAAEQYGTDWEAAAAGCIKPPLKDQQKPSISQ